jgi:pullulanase-type alpha-1,6-glucosidase
VSLSLRVVTLLRGAGVAAACLGLLVLAAPVANADHTPTPTGVALVGSLQSELGCPGDWQPECSQTELLPVAGSPGVYRATFDVPAGDYMYKVALNDSWDENYGAGGAPGGADIPITAPGGPVTFTYDHATHVITDDTPKALGSDRGAHWLRHGLIAWNLPDDRDGWTYRLHAAPNGGLTAQGGQIEGGSSFPLSLRPTGLPADLRDQDPHLSAYEALELPASARRQARELLTGQLVVAAYKDGELQQSTGLQIPRVLDELYKGAYDADLGPTWEGVVPSLAVWAPTAKNVDVLVDPPGLAPEQRVPMDLGDDGVWRVTGDPTWRNARYIYDVTVYVPTVDDVVTNSVTDPYSLGLTLNSSRSILVDLQDAELKPAGWDGLSKPPLAQPEDTTIYELHVRDFSISDETVPEAHRGGFLAFTDHDSDGMRHLRGLAGAGLNTLHLLPLNDIASIPEDREDQQQPPCDLRSFPPDSEEQQECVGQTAANDAFNWGYDPLHYTTPEGSYSTDPDGTARIREFREAVMAINGTGLRVVPDVVYNHTPASGQDAKSILDRIVPGYYQRLEPTSGNVETSTCCQNTASEHRMMEKLMIDSLVTWAREYKVDGFRFDLMGHHSKANIVAVRKALDGLTPQKDGVDGKRMYLYGEGWNFGEVKDNARFPNATQLNMAGTEIGTFNDRLRDAVRGGGPFDEDMRRQGFASGLFTDPNGAETEEGENLNGSPEEQKARLLLYQDQIRVGLTGNLRDYTFVDREGHTVKGSDVKYGEASGDIQPVGYAADPADTITYVEAHDNETIFDALQYKLPRDTPMAARARMNTIAQAATALAQGPSFWHAGTDLLRSKSMDHNSYDSGDWFNRIDWSGQESTWGSGLPPARDNSERWDIMRPLLADPALKPAPGDMSAASARAADLLRIRFSSPLFRLGTAELVQERVSFPTGGPEQTPGVIVMAIDDHRGRDLDPRAEGVVVVFNASPNSTTQTVSSLTGRPFGLSSVQAGGSDPVVRQSSYDSATGAFTVPARTVAVFVEPAAASPAQPAAGPAGSVSPADSRCGNEITGTAAGERLTGTPRGDRLAGMDGDDFLDGLAGDDCVDGLAGNDVLRGSTGVDTVEGEKGNDRVNGNQGRDNVRGGTGDDRVSGGSGRDVLMGNTGRDRLYGGSAADQIFGNAGRDRISAGRGRDSVEGGSGNDTIYAKDGSRDSIDCGRGKDTVMTRDAIDKLTGCERRGRVRR